MVTTCAAVHGTLGNAPNKELLGGGLMGRVFIGLDSDRAGSQRFRKLLGETETEFVRNSKVLVDFEVQT
jgi:hypothetical protein